VLELLSSLAVMVGLLLPPRYRGRFPSLEGAGHQLAFASGLAQCVVLTAVYLVRFVQFGRGDVEIAHILMQIADKRGYVVFPTPAAGMVVVAEFFFKPVNLILFYLFFEGLVRTAAGIAGDKMGTLPLYVIAGIHDLIDKRKYKQYVGELIPDHLARGGEKQGYDLKVYSCRPKLHWNPYMTVEFEGIHYQYFKEEYGAAPRRFIYYLRKQHVGIPAVAIDHYKIDDVLKPEPDKWAGTPTVWDKAFPNWNLPPVVPDQIVRSTPRSDYDLKIYSCRRKEDWNTYVTIEFEEQWYQLIKDEKGTKAHPFVYYLRKAPQTLPAVVIRKYIG
jgi:hypothetical protein